MYRLRHLFFLGILLLASGCALFKKEEQPPEYVYFPLETQLPRGFVMVGDMAPEILADMRMYTCFNYLGKRMPGYDAPVIILTEKAAKALKKVSEDLHAQGFALRVYDAYRPDSVMEYVRYWFTLEADQVDFQYFPNLTKSQVYEKDLVEFPSPHSRGSTVDVTMVDMQTGLELDMGTIYGFLDPLSGLNYTKGLTAVQIQNRLRLKFNMEGHGFKANEKKWWEYTLVNEPYIKTYYNFPVRQYTIPQPPPEKKPEGK